MKDDDPISIMTDIFIDIAKCVCIIATVVFMIGFFAIMTTAVQEERTQIEMIP